MQKIFLQLSQNFLCRTFDIFFYFIILNFEVHVLQWNVLAINLKFAFTFTASFIEPTPVDYNADCGGQLTDLVNALTNSSEDQELNGKGLLSQSLITNTMDIVE